MPARSAERLEAQELSPYLILLFALLSTATLFDGFDAAMMTLAAPEVRASLDIDLEQWGYIFGFCRLGMIASFFFLLYADWIGRRALLMITVVGFTVTTGLTALVTDKYQFAACQFFARLFLTAEYALAVIVVGEEFPARLRGRAIAVLTSLATLGVVVIAKLQPYILLEEGAPTNWLYDFGQAGLAWLHALFGLESDGEAWRVLYFLGLAPLVLMLALRAGMRETRRFSAVKAKARDAGAALGWRDHLRNASIPWQPRYRRRTAIVAVLWNCVHLVTAPAVAFWVIYSREELGYSAHRIGDILFWGYLAGATGHFVAGWMVDRIGRKWTCSGFYILASFAIVGLFQTETLAGQYFWHISTVFCFLAAGTATHIYASELFPTEIRATGYGWTTNLFGRVTEVVTPLLVGAFVTTLGISWSVTVVAFGPILGALIVLRYAPETMGMTLEEIDEQLSRSEERVREVTVELTGGKRETAS
jgi:putative MFS transporter